MAKGSQQTVMLAVAKAVGDFQKVLNEACGILSISRIPPSVSAGMQCIK